MKTYRNFCPHVHTFANLYWAFRAARCGKRDRAAVSSFEFALFATCGGCKQGHEAS